MHTKKNDLLVVFLVLLLSLWAVIAFVVQKRHEAFVRPSFSVAVDAETHLQVDAAARPLLIDWPMAGRAPTLSGCGGG
jgi:hypothetical protein